jgi:hypothetical protein
VQRLPRAVERGAIFAPLGAGLLEPSALEGERLVGCAELATGLLDLGLLRIERCSQRGPFSSASSRLARGSKLARTGREKSFFNASRSLESSSRSAVRMARVLSRSRPCDSAVSSNFWGGQLRLEACSGLGELVLEARLLVGELILEARLVSASWFSKLVFWSAS